MTDTTVTPPEDLFAQADAALPPMNGDTPPSAGPESEPEAPVEPEGPPSTASMHFETKKFVLQALLEKASSVLPQKDILPVLKNFQIQADPGRLRVVATDLELSVVSTSEMVLVATPGIAVFPGKKMLEIIKEADDSEMVVDVQDGVARITVGRTTWDLRLQDGSEYPPLPEVQDVTLHPVDRVKFLGAISAVRYAAATDTVRPSLMMIDVSGGKMTSCDGVRFQQADLLGKDGRQQGQEFPLDLQIPIGAVDDLVRLLRTTDLAEIGIGESDYHLVFRVGADVFLGVVRSERDTSAGDLDAGSIP